MLVNDYNHTAAHGLGAVMGSKKLKAIVAWGTKRPRVHDKQSLIDAGLRWRKALQPRTNSAAQRKKSVGHGEAWGAITKLNWRSTIITDEAKGLDQNRVTLASLLPVPAHVPVGRRDRRRHATRARSATSTPAASGWTLFTISVSKAMTFCISPSASTISASSAATTPAAPGLAFEAWEKGVLGPDRTDGLKLEWGNLEAAETLARTLRPARNLARQYSRRRSERARRRTGRRSEELGRAHQRRHAGAARVATAAQPDAARAGRQRRHETAGRGRRRTAADLAYREKWGPLDPQQPDGWTHSHLITEQIRQACGLMGACWFALNDKPPDGVKSMLDSLNATTGWDVTLDELIDAGHRAIILQSVFGTQRGWIAEHDWQDVGPRFLEPIPDGKYKGFTIAKWLPDLIYEYYRISGRHEKTGRPYMDTLTRLGLEEFKEWSQLD